MYLDSKVVSRVDDTSIKLLIDALQLNPYELVISFDISEDGFIQFQHNSKEWMQK